VIQLANQRIKKAEIPPENIAICIPKLNLPMMKKAALFNTKAMMAKFNKVILIDDISRRGRMDALMSPRAAANNLK
jgi:hypothetical protein